MSPHSSRKSFLLKLGGLMAAVGVLPRLSANTPAPASAPAADRAVKLRPEARAVPRADL